MPIGLGFMAAELAERDPAEARELLDEAYAGLRKVADVQDGKEAHLSVSCVMGGLLPLVERLEPDRIEERLWLTAACRTASPGFRT